MFEHAERADTGVPAFLNVGHSVTDLDDRLHRRHLEFLHIGKIIYGFGRPRPSTESGLNHASGAYPCFAAFSVTTAIIASV